MSNAELDPGWHVLLEIARHGPASTREQADRVAQALGWSVEEEVDAERGQWMCALPQDDAAELEVKGFIKRECWTTFGMCVGEGEMP
jgi:hypothetical protein